MCTPANVGKFGPLRPDDITELVNLSPTFESILLSLTLCNDQFLETPVGSTFQWQTSAILQPGRNISQYMIRNIVAIATYVFNVVKI